MHDTTTDALRALVSAAQDTWQRAALDPNTPESTLELVSRFREDLAREIDYLPIGGDL
jgi:hypothetical protein